jgi:hypothetical protein
MSKISNLAVIIAVLALLGCNDRQNQNTENKNILAISIYHGGDIITMNDNKLEYAEAVVQEDGEIIFFGSKEDALKLYSDAKLVDLKGKTLMPGFIEPHLHPSLAAIMLQNEIIAPYDWKLPSVIKKGVTDPETNNAALVATKTYHMEGAELTLLANNGKEIIHFIKVDYKILG